MGEAVNYIALAIPIFFLLIGIELLIEKMQKTKLYRFNDAVTNISCGIGQQIIGVFTKTIVILGYVFLYNNYRFFDIQSTVWTWIILFIGVDFFYYWFHRAAHEISILWGSHVVHHQSEEYNLSVALRQGWVQNFFSNIFYLPLAIIGFNPILFITINSFQTLYQFWIHTKTINRLPKPIEYVFNTPSHHRVHHGVNPKYIDRNHGGTLIIFDRIFGTFQAEEEEVVYGITQQPHSWNPLWLNLEYWWRLFGDVQKADNWSDRINLLVQPPGWKPASFGEIKKKKRVVTPETFQKYDTTIPMGLNYYILLQYALVLIGASAFLFLSASLSILLKILCASLVILAIVNLGALFEKKTWVWYVEHLRLLITAALVIVLSLGLSTPILIIVLSVFFLLGSIIWLNGYRSLFVAGS